MLIKILGPGCRNCAALERATRDALTRLGWNATVEHVTDYPAIAAYGVMSTPALVADEQVLLTGKVPTAARIADLLTARALQDPGTVCGPPADSAGSVA
ncbi:MAG TPA: thioredoxin family protein [Thermomicrobiaceae bacterium]|nr:thioredoxin family protein [Thermomicrobiaceae bacterium]